MDMSEAKWTKGPWTLELVQKFPWGIKILSGSEEVLSQDAICHCSKQNTRQDNEDGIGFDWRSKLLERQKAIDMIAQQDANANLIAASPDLYEALKALPLDSFDAEDIGRHEAADFADHAGQFFEAMQKARAALNKANGRK